MEIEIYRKLLNYQLNVLLDQKLLAKPEANRLMLLLTYQLPEEVDPYANVTTTSPLSTE